MGQKFSLSTAAEVLLLPILIMPPMQSFFVPYQQAALFFHPTVQFLMRSADPDDGSATAQTAIPVKSHIPVNRFLVQ